MLAYGRKPLIDVEVGLPWYARSEVIRTDHLRVWGAFALFTFLFGNFFIDDILDMLLEKHILRYDRHGCLSCGIFGIVVCIFLVPYFLFFIAVSSARLSGPYRLRRSEKQWFDCAFVVVCSCWTVYMRGDQTNLTNILGLVYCFHVIPMLNLWWDYENFGVWDCLLTALIEMVLFVCGNYGMLLTAVAAGVGVALQLKKNASKVLSRLWGNNR